MSKSGSIKREPSISIIIPSYNSNKTISYTLESLQKQNDKYIKEILIIDSSDKDNIHDITVKFKSKKIIVINAGKRVKPAIGRNLGAEKSKGSILLFLDSDVILKEDYIDHIINAYTNGILVGNGAIDVPEFQLKKMIVLAQYYLQLSEYIPTGEIRHKDMMAGCNLFCDREIFFKIGGFPDIRAAEDVQFGILANTLTKTWFIPEAVVKHIFREDLEGYLNNQELLGTFVGVYRSKNSKSIIYKGIIPIIMIPFFYMYKYSLVSIRVFRSGFIHVARYIKVFPLVIIGVCYWTYGMVRGTLKINKYE